MKPANIRSISLNEATQTVHVLVGKDDLSLAIGKRGQNARLTSKLTGWDVEIDEDKTAEQVLESQKAQAAHSMAEALGINEVEAQTLAAGGMNSIEVILTADAEDIAGLLGCDVVKGQKILDAARASGAAPGNGRLVGHENFTRSFEWPPQNPRTKSQNLRRLQLPRPQRAHARGNTFGPAARAQGAS